MTVCQSTSVSGLQWVAGGSSNGQRCAGPLLSCPLLDHTLKKGKTALKVRCLNCQRLLNHKLYSMLTTLDSANISCLF